jgi:hypothetical protein
MRDSAWIVRMQGGAGSNIPGRYLAAAAPMSVSHHPCMVKEYYMIAVGRAEFDCDSALTKYMAVRQPPWSAAEGGAAAR